MWQILPQTAGEIFILPSLYKSVVARLVDVDFRGYCPVATSTGHLASCSFNLNFVSIVYHHGNFTLRRFLIHRLCLHIETCTRQQPVDVWLHASLVNRIFSCRVSNWLHQLD